MAAPEPKDVIFDRKKLMRRVINIVLRNIAEVTQQHGTHDLTISPPEVNHDLIWASKAATAYSYAKRRLIGLFLIE